MSKKKSETLKIEINKKKLITTISVSLVIIVLGLVCFFASASKAGKYSNKPESVTLNDEGEVSEGEEDILTEATREAGEINDEARSSLSEITVNDYLGLYESNEYSLVLLSRDTCGYCKIAIPILENIKYEYKVDIKYIDVGKMSDDDLYNLVKSDDVFNEGYGTPFLMVVGKNKIKDSIDGLATKEEYISFFQEYKFIGDNNE